MPEFIDADSGSLKNSEIDSLQKSSPSCHKATVSAPESGGRNVKERITIGSEEKLREQGADLTDCVIQDVDLAAPGIDWDAANVRGAIFLGCYFPDCEFEVALRRRGALIFPRIEGFPYNPFRSSLYTWEELMEGYDWESFEDRSVDCRIYSHVESTGNKPGDIIEALSRRIHDHSIDQALNELLSQHQRVVGIMGGHSMRRTDEFYRKVARLGQGLTRENYFIVTGGGPGVMEAGNLGAYMGSYGNQDLEEALSILAEAPEPETGDYQARSLEALRRFPGGCDNLAIPTWFYPHEPTNLFASHIAKYFSNSIREDGLLAICIHGVVYCPGSAGTTEEIFIDATQNHYGSFGFYSPMVFLGRERYTQKTSLYPMLQNLASGRDYGKLLFLSDEPGEIIEIIKSHPPVPVESKNMGKALT